MLRIPICLLIAGTVAFSVFGLNEARIIETEFVEYPIIEKEMYQDRSWEGYSYILYYDTMIHQTELSGMIICVLMQSIFIL